MQQVGLLAARRPWFAAERQIVRENGGVLQIANSDGRTNKSFTLSRAAMAKLNEVEGVVMTAAGKRTFKEFDSQGLTPAQRRARLRKQRASLRAGIQSVSSAPADQGRSKV